MIKIIVDSTADLPSDYFVKYDIDIVPLVVNINGVVYRDNIDISLDELYEELKKGSDIKTSQPNINDIYETIEKYVKNNDDIIFITISSGVSGTYQTVHMVKEELLEKYPDAKIKIIDSRGGSAIAGLMALQAARFVRRNIPFAETVETLEDMAQSGEHIFTVNDLKYLFKGGRLSRASAIIGNLLKIKPILHVKDGVIELYEKVRGQIKAINHIIDIVVERIKAFPEQIIGIMHADDYEFALDVKNKIIERIGEKKFIIGQIGSVIGTHIGIGGVGVFFFNRKPKYYFLED